MAAPSQPIGRIVETIAAAGPKYRHINRCGVCALDLKRPTVRKSDKMSSGSKSSLMFLLLVALALQGCVANAWNAPLGPSLAATPVTSPIARNTTLSDRSDDVFVVLAFSGGGMRSAAFSYGVLETLRDTRISLNGSSRRLLDEVDVITSVSGGSYTAAYYGLFGNRIFLDYQNRFLKRDVQGALTALLANPLVLASMTWPTVNRSDIAASWLDANIFDHKTFANMRAQPGPTVIINASDLNTGTTFSFIQQQFDFLCSRLDTYSVARAVMASSAVPGFFAPVAVRNYDLSCPQRKSAWVSEALAQQDIFSRDYHVARALDRYSRAGSLPVVRLVDGGMTDNLGVRGSMMSPVLHRGNVVDMAGAFDDDALDTVSNVLVIVANAQIYEEYDWSRAGSDPGLIGALEASFDSAIGILNSETLSLARRGFNQWSGRVNRRPARKGKPPVRLSFVALTLDQIKDERRRKAANAIPMSLSISATQVDELRALARQLLAQSAEFRDFKSNLK